jgi:GT2 family glycosyltransferase
MSTPVRNVPMSADLRVLITVGVTTRNRADALLRCLRSLELIADLVGEIIVADDSSDPPVADMLHRAPAAVGSKLRVITVPHNGGYIVGRNMIMRLASNEYVLSMDDDAYVIDAKAVTRAVDVLARHPRVGAVAFAQGESNGQPWPAAMQPAPAQQPCLVTAFIGFAHLLRRTLFLEVGGYRETFEFYGEERDYCLRLLDAGRQVVYLPDALVAHVPDPSGRSPSRYLRYVIRNDCLSAMYNEPLLLALATVPVRLRRYGAMRRGGNVIDPGGFWWIVRELAAAIPDLVRNRTPVRWGTVRRWRALRRDPPPFAAIAPLSRSAA